MSRFGLLLLVLAGCRSEYHWTSNPTMAVPLWTTQPAPPTEIGCVSVETWVAKSGKTGVGMTVALTARRPTCQVELVDAALSVGQRLVPAASDAVLVTGPRPTYRYLVFRFDNDQAWRSGGRTGTAAFTVRAEGATSRLDIPLEQRLSALERSRGWVSPPDAACFGVEHEVIGMEPDLLAVRLRLRPRAGPCRVRFGGARLERPASGRVEQAPQATVWQELPATWVLAFRRQPSPSQPRLGWRAEIDVVIADGIVVPLELDVGYAIPRIKGPP